MTAAEERVETKAPSLIPDMAKEVIFWCAVFVAVVTGAVLISQMGSGWPVSVPVARSAPIATPTAMAPSAAPSTFPSASEALIVNASESAEQPATF